MRGETRGVKSWLRAGHRACRRARQGKQASKPGARTGRDGMGAGWEKQTYGRGYATRTVEVHSTVTTCRFQMGGQEMGNGFAGCAVESLMGGADLPHEAEMVGYCLMYVVSCSATVVSCTQLVVSRVSQEDKSTPTHTYRNTTE